MNDSQLRALLKQGKPSKTCVERGLYFRVSNEGTGFWVLRYTSNKKRKEYTFARYGKDAEGLGLSLARDEAAKIRARIRKGADPLAEKHRSKVSDSRTIDKLFESWVTTKTHLKHPEKPIRLYENHIQKIIGEINLNRISPLDVHSVIESIKNKQYPTIANDALSLLKELFNHGVKLGLLEHNPASAFNWRDAGGNEKPRDRALSITEIESVFRTLALHQDIFTRDNHIAFILLLTLCVRKGELIAAKWEEFNLNNKIWTLPESRTKTGKSIRIPIAEELMPVFEELRYRSLGSEYLFPSRRKSKRRPYISDDTLNHALAKMFGKKVDSNKKPYPNLLGEDGVSYFVVHDLRRTARTLLAEINTPPHIAERCLNHKLKGVEGIYDRYDYLAERSAALNALAQIIVPISQSASQQTAQLFSQR